MAQRHERFSSLAVLPRTDTAGHGQSREHTAVSTVGSCNAVSEISTSEVFDILALYKSDYYYYYHSRLSEYTLAIEQVRRCCGTVL